MIYNYSFNSFHVALYEYEYMQMLWQGKWGQDEEQDFFAYLLSPSGMHVHTFPLRAGAGRSDLLVNFT